MPNDLTFQLPHPFEQFAGQLPNLFRGSLRLLSTLKSSLSFQMGVSRLVHSFINVVLDNLKHQCYVCEGSPPLMDAEGQVSWVVYYILGHDDPQREAI